MPTLMEPGGGLSIGHGQQVDRLLEVLYVAVLRDHVLLAMSVDDGGGRRWQRACGLSEKYFGEEIVTRDALVAQDLKRVHDHACVVRLHANYRHFVHQ